ncbi:MAG: ferrous iron transport protein B [Lentisphaeria bacterium]|nr:ferrous iron transport protein B [Lentisphaeria bacterium]
MSRKYRIVLAGNPNCGKTTIFNCLTGARQHVGNYPGVTVESKTGEFMLGEDEIELIDIPGVYSLSSSSPEEGVAFEELTKPGIDLIMNVIDSSIPQRSLYLSTQLAELHIPMLIVFNMSDEAKKKGLKFNIQKLQSYFGCSIVQTVGSRGDGIDKLKNALAESLLHLEDHDVPKLTYGADVDDAIHELEEWIEPAMTDRIRHIPARFFAIKLLEKDTCVMRLHEFQGLDAIIDAQITHLYARHAITAETFMADCRYAMISGACRDAISFTQERRREISDKIDAVVTNQWIGLPLFFAVMYLMFWFTFTCAAPMTDGIEWLFGWIQSLIERFWSPDVQPVLRSLLIDGVIHGVGGVIVFLPNILFLFLAIAFLEDTGYMARAAFVMDGIMRKFDLQGKSFVPLVLGFGCNVPAIMATRSIESERDRRTTILVLPLMSCGARLPIYALLIPAFFAVKYQAFVMFLIYAIGVAFAMLAARLLKSTLFKGDGEVYLMELPPYRVPTAKSILLHMWDRGVMYLQKAGTIILGVSVLLFIANNFPEKKTFDVDYGAQIMAVSADTSLSPEEQSAAFKRIERMRHAEAAEYTVSGRVGKFLEPAFKPVGFDWRVTTAAISALAAKEIFVSQLGILYAEDAESTGDEVDEQEPLRQQLRRAYTPLQGFCMMLFCLLSIPCLATLAIIRRELNSWKWMFFEAAGLFVLAYVTTFIVYQLGLLLKIGTNYLL